MVYISLLLILLIIAILIGYLFKLNEKKQTFEEKKIKTINKEINERNYNKNIELKFISFIKEYKNQFNSFDINSLDSRKMSDIKKEINALFRDFINQKSYKSLKEKEPKNEIVLICEDISKSNIYSWFKNNNKKIDNIINNYEQKK